MRTIVICFLLAALLVVAIQTASTILGAKEVLTHSDSVMESVIKSTKDSIVKAENNVEILTHPYGSPEIEKIENVNSEFISANSILSHGSNSYLNEFKKSENLSKSNIPVDENSTLAVDLWLDMKEKALNLPALSPVMVPIVGGSYIMGAKDYEYYAHYSEKPSHKVAVPSFYISKYVITVREYNVYLLSMFGMDAIKERDSEYPALLTLSEAIEYIDWLSVITDEKFRLPTEAEWEYMARAGTQTPFYTGECIGMNQANYLPRGEVVDCTPDENDPRNYYVEVSDLNAGNPWGVWHVLGNMWELTADCWHENYESAPVNGIAWGKENNGDCGYRVARGGSVWGGINTIRASSRLKIDITKHPFSLRLAKNPNQRFLIESNLLVD